jgi:hypothetical protein
MRYERLQEDFDAVLKQAGIEGHYEIPRENITPAREGKSYREFYSKKSRRMVEDAYASHLEKYDYSF